MGAAQLMVPLTMTDTPTHGPPGHAGVRTSVVGLVTKVQAVLVGIKTPHSFRGVTVRELGLRPTLPAESIIVTVQRAALTAAVLIVRAGQDYVRSAVTVSIPADALIPAHVSPRSVVAGVGVAGDLGVTRVSRPHCYQQHQRDYCGQDLHFCEISHTFAELTECGSQTVTLNTFRCVRVCFKYTTLCETAKILNDSTLTDNVI